LLFSDQVFGKGGQRCKKIEEQKIKFLLDFLSLLQLKNQFWKILKLLNFQGDFPKKIFFYRFFFFFFLMPLKYQLEPRFGLFQ